MKLDLTHLSRQKLGNGPSIDHYYELFKENDDNIDLNIILRDDQKLNKRWLRNISRLVTVHIWPKCHRDHYFLKSIKNEHNQSTTG